MNIRQRELINLMKEAKKVAAKPDQFLPMAEKIYAELYKKKYRIYYKQEKFLRKIQTINAIRINILIHSLTDLIYQKVKTFTPESLASLETYELKNKSNDIQQLQELLTATIPLYVQDTILAIKAISHRSMIIEGFIFAAEECLYRNNFMLAKAIYGGLIQANVLRLIQEGEIIKGLSPDAMISLELLKALFNDIMENNLKAKVKSTDGPMLYSVSIFFAASRKVSGDIDCKKLQLKEKEKQQTARKVSENINTNTYIEKSFLQNTIKELQCDIDFILDEHTRECEKEYKYQFVEREYGNRIDEQSISINLQQEITRHAAIRSYIHAMNHYGFAKDIQRKTGEDLQLTEDASTIEVLKKDRACAETKINETLLIIQEFDKQTEAASYECRSKHKKITTSILIQCLPEISLPDKALLYRKYRSAIAEKAAMKLALSHPQILLDDIKIKLIRLANYGANKNNDKTEKKKNRAIKILDYLYQDESLDLKIKYLYDCVLMTHTSSKTPRTSWIAKFKFVSLINQLIISLEKGKDKNKKNNDSNKEKKLLEFILNLEENQSDILSRACIHSLQMIYNDLDKIKPGAEKLKYLQKSLFLISDESNVLNLFDKMNGDKIIKLLTELYSKAQLETRIEITNKPLGSTTSSLQVTEEILPADDICNMPTQSNSSPNLETIELFPQKLNKPKNEVFNESINSINFWRNSQDKHLPPQNVDPETVREQPATLKRSQH